MAAKNSSDTSECVHPLPWMVVGHRVFANDKAGIITRVEKVKHNGSNMVAFIYVRLSGGKHNVPYFPRMVAYRK